jgi:hypothetical protein
MKAYERRKSFDEETLTIVVIICMCTFKHGEKMHVESYAVLHGGGRSEYETLESRSEHDTLDGTEVSRNRKRSQCNDAIETGLASRPAHRRLSRFTLVSSYD